MGALLTTSTVMMCSHGGKAQVATPGNSRVCVQGQPTVRQSDFCGVAGCPFVPPAGNGPCVTAQWLPALTSKRVRSAGVPLVLMESMALAVPTGTPLQILAGPTRVKAL